MSPDETISSHASRGTHRSSNIAATRCFGTGALETSTTVPPSRRKRISASHAVAYGRLPS